MTPGRWQAYTTAWQLHVKPSHNLRTNEQITNWIAPSDLNDGPFRRRSSPSLDYLVRFDNQPIRVIATFKLMTQTICEYTYATVMTRKWKRDLVDGDNEGLWLQWYATLKALRRRFPEAVDTAHWLATHNLRGGKHIGGVRYATNAPNNAHRTCMLCRVELETLEHVFADCRRSQRVIAAIYYFSTHVAVLWTPEYDPEELRKALDTCNQRSSPGPGGRPFEFYAATWAHSDRSNPQVLNSLATSNLATL
ncbi:hypothetical protein ACM66B_002011 [Microbotryomycetes sp. NB124-2]